jgi:hypothetical protein
VFCRRLTYSGYGTSQSQILKSGIGLLNSLEPIELSLLERVKNKSNDERLSSHVSPRPQSGQASTGLTAVSGPGVLEGEGTVQSEISGG